MSLKMTCLTLALAVAVVAVPTVAADEHCPNPAEPSPNPWDAIAGMVQQSARSACLTLATACRTADVDEHRCWITLE